MAAARQPKSRTTPDAQMVNFARRIASPETRARALSRELAEVRDELKSKRRMLKALVQEAADTRRPDAPPMRIYGETQEG